MNDQENHEIMDIPLDQIRIINPRARARKQHRAIVENIAAVGLKRPVTVSRCGNSSNGATYNLVCGQGRIEAVRSLGYDTIPARVIEKDEVGCLEMSLVENVARRNHSAIELIRDIKFLVSDGQAPKDVAARVGLSLSYLQSLLTLLEQGEERLVAAVEQGSLPIGLAISIARSTDTELQLALSDAYADGTLKHRQLAVVRRIIEQRQKNRGTRPSGTNSAPNSSSLTPEKLRKLYIRESEKQYLLSMKADMVHAKLNVLVTSMKALAGNPEFVALLREENIVSMPRVLSDRLNGVSHDPL
ncbi:plasmid partitioning protein RepB C-terminal domain-containing protein [Paraburkholderia sp. C35]|uniref:plasmid partitioning protein RepB C-terminal domain-containing protein n=1 Tax=Paraburkholderia sp. C35 TaxID=2126993 RepID=UPI000D699D11|nr:plasmid partitioning protein RepB C-terminal domain-containing protein [Paraburkholderia sp. C35]